MVGALNFINQKIGESSKSLKVVWIGHRLMGQISLQIFQRVPRNEINGQLAFFVTWEDPLNFGKIGKRKKCERGLAH